jgi:NADH-quinone oxidoreductase subunit L
MHEISTNLLHTLLAAAPALQQGSSAAPASSGLLNLPTWYALIPILPLLAFVLCGLTAAFRVKSKLPAWLTVLCLGVSFIITVLMANQVLGGDHARTGIIHVFDWINFEWRGNHGKMESFIADFAFYIDPLTCLWMLFVTGLATLIALYASEYMAGDVGVGYSRFFAGFALFVFSMACLVMADNYLLLYLGWEGVGLCSYLLIGYFYKKPSAVAAAKKAFIVNRIGDLFLALGIMLIYVHTHSLEYNVVFAKMQGYIDLAREGHWSEIPLMVQAIPFLLLGGAIGKSAQIPLYVWLPDAMEGPTPVSALIHAATMVTAGVFLVARNYPLFQSSEFALPTVAWVGSLTALLSATIGMAQFDIKRIMAYSTVSQLGYMLAGLGVLTSTGACFHVLTHAFFKALLFLCCGAVMHGFAGQLDLRKLSGVAFMKGWGIVGFGMLIGCLNLAGFPGTAGFFSKDMILAEAFKNPREGSSIVGWILLITAGLTAYYTFRVFFRVFVGPKLYEPGDEVDGHGADEHGHDDHGDGHAAPAHAEAGHGHGEFHPHAPGWAINTVLALLTIGALGAAGLNFVGSTEGGWVGKVVEESTAAVAIESPARVDAAPSTTEGLGIADHRFRSLTMPTHIEVPAGKFNGNPPIGFVEVEAGKTPNNNFLADPLITPTRLESAENHGTFLGKDPHGGIMYVASSIVGLMGIGIAFMLHYAGRTTAATSRADALIPKLGPIPRWAQHKWYVDEFYDFLIVRPLWVIAHIFYFIDQFVIDNIVDLLGWLPRKAGDVIRPSQSGELHGYAIGMAGGIAVLIIIILAVAS